MSQTQKLFPLFCVTLLGLERKEKRYLGALIHGGEWPTSHLYAVPPCSDGCFGHPPYGRPLSLSHLGDQGSWELLNRRGLWSSVGNTRRCLGGAERTGSFAPRQHQAGRVSLLPKLLGEWPALTHRKHSSFVLFPL